MAVLLIKGLTCLKGFVQDRTKPLDLAADDGVRYWQERLVLAFVMVCTYLGFLVYLPSLALSIKESLWLVAVADTLMYGWMIFLYWRRDLSYNLRAGTIVFFTYTLGLVLLLTIGPYGAGPVWLFAFPVVTALLLSLRSSLAALILNGVTLIVLGFFLDKGIERWGGTVLNSIEKWFVVGMNFMLLNVLVTLSVAQVARGLSQALKRQKNMLDRLAESEERFRTLFESAPDGYFLYDLNGMLLDGNSTLEGLLGCSREELVGRRIADLFMITGGKQTSVDMIVRQNQQLQGSGPDECILNRNHGESILVELLTRPTTIKNDTLVLGIVRDIRERKKLEASLTHAQKMESIGTLAGGVAHDFNNMLGIIIGHADMILEQMEPNQPFHDDLVEIRKAGVRSADLTRQLLAFARKQTVAPKVIDLNDTLEGMLKMLRRLIGEDIDLLWKPVVGLWPVMIDPTQIDQILANLCVNARDAIAGVGKMTIETGNTVFDEAYCKDHVGFVPGAYALIAVSDNGCGMDSETISHLFEPFFTTKEIGKGTGLGLSTVYGVVKQNKGFINVYSEPGQGTTFKIYLPRHLSKAVSLLEKEADKPSKRGFETVLLVEDEPAILRMTTIMLEWDGYTVLAAGTPVEAIRLAHEHVGDIHILMTDVVMPEMNGRNLAKKIISIYPQLKCLFMSGYTANVIAHHGVLDEGVNFIQKPFSKTDLNVKVREALDRDEGG